MDEYDRISECFVRTRRGDVGLPEVARLAASLPVSAKVLDVGCGDGVPISKYLSERGLRIYGIDSSPRMIALYRANFPDAPTQCSRIEDSDLFGEQFDAIVAWSVLFHLSRDRQIDAIARISRHLRGGGQFLFTSGDVEGAVESTMHGERFRYTSLGVDGYVKALGAHGFTLADHHADMYDNHVYVAERTPPHSPSLPERV
jgi:SAM-dependent methyltransferase